MFKEIPLPPGAIGSHGDAINRLGDVVGTSWTAQTADTMQQSAYLFHNGVSTDLNTLISAPGWHLTFAQDINDAGQITGYGTLDGIPTAFLLSPPSRFSLGEISLPELVGILLGGVAIDGGGWIIIGGVPHPVDPWGLWMQIQPEKRDALVALAMDEIAMFLVDGAARETVRTTLTGIATSRLQALNVQRGRAGSLSAARGRVGARPPLVIRQGKLATLLARRR